MARRAAGSRNHPVQADLAGALGDGTSEVEELKNEMEEWAESLESNSMEHLPKYDEVTEAKDALEAGLDTLQGIEVPEFLESIDASYTQDTRRKAQSRSYRLGNATNAIEAAKDAANSWLEENDELELMSDADAIEDGAEEVTQEMVDERRSQRDDAEQFASEVENALGELENVSFPSMY
jgi:hypothetical protein